MRGMSGEIEGWETKSWNKRRGILKTASNDIQTDIEETQDLKSR